MRGEIRIIVHATEDMDKILSSISEVLKIDIEKEMISRRDLSGHYGNPITYMSIKLDDEDIKNLFYVFKKSMSPNQLSEFLSTLDDYMDRSVLYIRIDKQKLCEGILRLVEEDPIKIIIRNINKNVIKKWLESDEK